MSWVWLLRIGYVNWLCELVRVRIGAYANVPLLCEYPHSSINSSRTTLSHFDQFASRSDFGWRTSINYLWCSPQTKRVKSTVYIICFTKNSDTH